MTITLGTKDALILNYVDGLTVSVSFPIIALADENQLWLKLDCFQPSSPQKSILFKLVQKWGETVVRKSGKRLVLIIDRFIAATQCTLLIKESQFFKILFLPTFFPLLHFITCCNIYTTN